MHYMLINLNLMLTRNCNFNCAHCLRGEAANEVISKDVLNAIFKPGIAIQNLQLNGGEVFSRPDILSLVIDTIIQNRVMVNNVNIPTNGTLYTESIEKELDRLNKYVATCNLIMGELRRINIEVDLSDDKYHRAELEKLKETNVELYNTYNSNIDRLLKSKYFTFLKPVIKLVDAGKAKELNEQKVEPECYPVYYCETKTPQGILFEASNLGIDINGYICNTYGEMPPRIENIYGNCLESDISTVIKKIGIKCTDEDDLFTKYESYVLKTMKEDEQYYKKYKPNF